MPPTAPRPPSRSPPPSPSADLPTPGRGQPTNGNENSGIVPPAPHGASAAEGAAIITVMLVGQSKTGKLQLQFSTDDSQTFRLTLPVPAMVDMLPTGWTAGHLKIGQAYGVKFRLHWREAGKYKNVFQRDRPGKGNHHGQR